MSIVDQCGLEKEITCSDSSGSMWFMKNNTHAINSSGSLWFMKRTHMQWHLVDPCGLGIVDTHVMTLVDPCGLGKEHTFNDSSGGLGKEDTCNDSGGGLGMEHTCNDSS